MSTVFPKNAFWLILLLTLSLNLISSNSWAKPSWKTDESSETNPKGQGKGNKKNTGGTENPITNDIAISLHPQSLSVNELQSITFNVSATGSGTLRYQWRKNGVAIADAIHSYLQLSAVNLTDEGSYDVVISNEAGNLISDTAILTVNSLVNVSLSWNHPTQREDGSVLGMDEIAEYRIYILHDNETASDILVAGSDSEVTLEKMIAGVYEFSISTIDTDGREGPKSAPITVITN